MLDLSTCIFCLRSEDSLTSISKIHDQKYIDSHLSLHIVRIKIDLQWYWMYSIIEMSQGHSDSIALVLECFFACFLWKHYYKSCNNPLTSVKVALNQWIMHMPYSPCIIFRWLCLSYRRIFIFLKSSCQSFALS